MDYTKVPRYLIYQEKRNLEDFIENEQSLDNLMLKKIENSHLVNFPNASEYVLEIYNAAYYITTLILLQKRPLLHFSSYLNIASHIAAAPGCQNTFHQLFECTSMAMVCNYLQLLKPKQLDYSVFYNKLELWFRNYNVVYSRMFSNIVLDIMTAQKYDFYPDRFNLRPIIDALKESNKEDIFNNIEYIKARIMELDTDQMQIATEMVFNKAEMTGKLYVADSLSTEEENVRIKMEEVLQMIGPGWSVFNPSVLQPMTEEDIDNAIAEAEGKTIDGNNSDQTATLEERIKELEAENEKHKNRNKELKEQIEELQNRLAEGSSGQQWIDWLDDDVFKPNFNAEKIAEAIHEIQAPHLTPKCYWYVVFRVLNKINWLSKDVTQKAFLKWANAHFSLGWKGEQQFKFSEINDSIKKVADIDDWDKYTMKTNQGQYYAELRDKLYKVFVEKLPNGKLFDRTEFIKQGQLRVNNGH